ncbi:MAG: lasso peptide biosynthesis B2 protein [Balneolales bacterium]
MYQRLIIETLFGIVQTSFVVRFCPFRVLAWLMSGQKKQNRKVSMDLDLAVQNVVKSVVLVSRRIPWRSECLVQASAAKIMLNKRGIPNVMCLGVSKSGVLGYSKPDPELEVLGAEIIIGEPGKREMRPHAWLIANGQVILGGGNLDDYVTVSQF